MNEKRGAPAPPHGGDDPLDREIRRLLAVAPSPAFEARVRGRVANELAPDAWRAGRFWLALATAAATAAVVLMATVSLLEPPADTGAEPSGVVAETGDVAPPPSGDAARRETDRPVSDLSPPTTAELNNATGPAAAGATGPRAAASARAGDATSPPSGTAARPREDGSAADRNPATGPAFPSAPSTEPRDAAGPPRATAAPPSPPRFTRVVFSESERGALRRLLGQARDQPVVVPVPAGVRMPNAGELPAALALSYIALEPPAGIEIPPITIEPLNLALLDTGAVE